MSLVVLGTVALDNVKTPSGIKKDMLGGSASHFSMSARLFTDVNLVGVVGKDFPDKHMQFLKRKGVETSSLKMEKGKTFAWRGEYKKGDFNNAITLNTKLGVLENYTPEITPYQAKLPNLFLANYDPDIQEKMISLMEKPRIIGLDTMNLWINIKLKSVKRLMKKVNVFVLNDGEAYMLTKEDNLIKAAERLNEMGPEVVVLKKGEHGVIVKTKKFTFGFPAFPVDKVVDPTGAGDTFAGGLMGYLSKTGKLTESNLRQAVIYGSVLGSYNVEGFGMGKTAPLTMREVERRKKIFEKFFSVA